MKILRSKLIAVVFSLFLQILPICKVASTQLLNPATASIVIRLVMFSAAMLGSVDAVSGASTVITSPTTARGTNGVSFLYTITTGPLTADTWYATNLPPGLSVGLNTGKITGIPNTTGVWLVNLVASEANIPDRTTRTNLTITIVDYTPLIVTNPPSITTNVNSSVTMSVTANGAAPLVYQWRLNGTSIANATNRTYTFVATALTAGSYTCFVTNNFGNITSAAGVLTISAIPTITKQPTTQTAVSGSSVAFSVNFTGVPSPTFQWKKNNVNIAGATASSLTLNNVTVADAGKYSVTLVNMAGTVTSSQATLSILDPPVITLQPVSKTVLLGTPVSFTSAATGSPAPTFQWQLNGIDILDAINPNYDILSAQISDAGDYTVTASSLVGSAVSQIATLTVVYPPVITSDITDLAINVGDPISMTLGADANPLPTYQWFKDNVKIQNETNNTFSILSSMVSDAGNYYCIASNAWGSATSHVAVVSIQQAPVVTLQPVNKSAYTGDSVTFSCSGTGIPTPTYQWYKNGVIIIGATSPSLTIVGVSAQDAGSYNAIISNSLGSIATLSVTLNVQVLVNITNQPFDILAIAGSVTNLSVGAIGNSLTYQWYKDNVLVSNQTNSSIVFNPIGTNDQGNYFAVVGSSALSLTSSVAHVEVQYSPIIVTAPSDLSVSVGSLVQFSVSTLANPAPTYQWYKDGVIIPNETNSTFNISSSTLADNGLYSVVASNVVGSSVGGPASLQVLNPTPPSITTQPKGGFRLIGQSFTLSVSATGPDLQYQWQFKGLDLLNQTNSSLSLSNLTLFDCGIYNVIVYNAYGSQKSYDAALIVNEAAVILAQPSSVYGNPGDNVSFTVLAEGLPQPVYQWRFNGIDIVDQTNNILSLNNIQLSNAGSYTVLVSNNLGFEESIPALLTVGKPPIITTQPVSATNTVGQTRSLSVVATGIPSPTYQWRKNGFDIAGQTNSVLTLSNLTTNDEANYSVFVVNGVGSVISDTVHLTVGQPPIITVQPVNLIVKKGDTTTISVTATGTPTLYYQWFKDGVGTSHFGPSFSLINITTNSAGNYYVVITNAYGVLQSSTINLNVLEGPTILTQPVSVVSRYTSNVTFSVTAIGNPSPSYQWKKGGVNIPGATSNVLQLNNLKIEDQGDYSVSVANVVSTVLSSSAHLTVNPNEGQIVLSSLNICVDGTIALFDVNGPPFAIVQVQASVDLASWVTIGALKLDKDGKGAYGDQGIQNFSHRMYKVIY